MKHSSILLAWHHWCLYYLLRETRVCTYPTKLWSLLAWRIVLLYYLFEQTHSHTTYLAVRGSVLFFWRNTVLCYLFGHEQSFATFLSRHRLMLFACSNFNLYYLLDWRCLLCFSFLRLPHYSLVIYNIFIAYLERPFVFYMVFICCHY